MAVYSDNMPDGVDVIFNTNKKSGTPTKDVLKKIKDDPDNPFGSLIKEHGGQSYYDDPKGKYTDPVTGKKQSLSLINKRAEEGDWGEWSKTLPSQFLSKQSLTLIKKQLGLAKADKQAEYDEICSLTNPTVKKALLKSFADDCDAAAVHLQAAALPRQKYQVILPLTTIKDNEVYAPNYKDGETVALIRYPHGGTFEIPILKVNNKLAEGKSVLGNTPADAIGINKKNADRLSGADFDGDTVMVIPCNSTKSKVKITSTSPLKGLEGFDTKDAYGGTVKKDVDGVDHYYRNGKEYKIMRNTQTEMGKVSNLITDMTLKGATQDELARAVRHSMVVIDAEKHKLDYKQSEIDNGIASLKKKYQGNVDSEGRYHEGASTLISRAKSETQVLKRKGSPTINEDGSLSYKSVKEEYVDKNGKIQVRTQKSTKMAETKDARSTALIQLGNNGIDGFINAFTDASGRVTSAATSMLTTFINAANAQKGNLTSTFTTMMQAVLTTLTNYQTQFNTAGSTLMTKFISGIKSQDGNTKTAITNIISGCITAINNKQTQFNTAGANLMIKLIAGVKSKDYETRNAFVNILSSCLTAIANKYPEFQNAGMQCMIKFIAGVKEKAEEVKTAFTGNLNASVTAIRDYHDQFKQAGTYLVEGFADGISENTYRAEAKARAMARAAAEAAEDELDEHSPSRVGYHIGDFFGLGFVNAIGTYAVKAYNASAEMADSAKTGLGNAIAKVKDMIDNGVDGQPTIRPILDLSDVEEKSHRLNTLFSRSQALTVSTGIAAARGRNLQNEDTNPNTGNSYNFTQNNYSPKALSRTEIYRQTKNQFSAMERMVET